MRDASRRASRHAEWERLVPAGAWRLLTTKTTVDFLPGGCECRSLGPHLLKNVAAPVEVVEVRRVEASEVGARRAEGERAHA